MPFPRFLRESENRIRWSQRFASNEQYQESVRSYYRLVSGMDKVIGEMMAQLEEQGLAENTVVLFTSDHGFYLGDRGFAGKWYPHDVSIRIPLVIVDPRQEPSPSGRRSNAIALNIDIAPTLLDYADLARPAVMQGDSLKPIMNGPVPSDWRTQFYYEHEFVYPTIPISRGVRTANTKYIVYPNADPVVEELYDLTTDPDEATNLATRPDHQLTIERMRARLKAYREELR